MMYNDEMVGVTEEEPPTNFKAPKGMLKVASRNGPSDQ